MAIADTVRTRILDLALSFEQLAPDAGQPGVDVGNAGAVSNIVTNVYGGSPNIAVASSSFSQTVSLPTPGDRTGLIGALEQLGVSRNEIDDLEALMDSGQMTEAGGEMTSGLSSWLGRTVARAESAAIDTMTGASGALIAQAVITYLSGPHPH